MIQEALFNQMSGFNGLTALIGAGATNCRAYYGLLPQQPTYPALTFTQVSSMRETAMGANPGIVHARYQFDPYDTDPEAVRNVMEQVRKCFDRFRGTNLSSVAQIFDCFPENIEGPYPELVDGQAVYRGIVEVLVQHTE